MAVESPTVIWSAGWGRGYLVNANMRSLDEVSEPLVLGFRKHDFVTQEQLDRFAIAAAQAYAAVFEHVRERLALQSVPSVP